jgi:hypothetical protein
MGEVPGMGFLSLVIGTCATMDGHRPLIIVIVKFSIIAFFRVVDQFAKGCYKGGWTFECGSSNHRCSRQ